MLLYYHFPGFLPRSLQLEKHINQESILKTLATQSTGEYLFTMPTLLEFKFSTAIPVSLVSGLGCQKITLTAPALAGIIPVLEAKHDEEQVV